MATAIQAIYRDLEYAKTLIKNRDHANATDYEVGDEESWTFIGDESDPELARRIKGWDPMVAMARRSAGAVMEGDAAAGPSMKGMERPTFLE